jgi:hypothetical protein
VNKLGICTSNEHVQPRRDDVHEALQQTHVVRGREPEMMQMDGKQEQSMQLSQVVLMWYEYLVLIF